MARRIKLADAAPLLLLAGAAWVARGPPRKERDRYRSRKSGMQDDGGGRSTNAGPAAAAQDGRGRHAQKPTEIPPKGWKDILLRTRREMNEDNVPMIAAGVTFYTLLALFPGLAAFVSVYGLFAEVGDVREHLAALGRVLPEGGLKVIGDQLELLAKSPAGGLSAVFVLGLATAVWSANGAMKAIMLGLNIAYEEKEKRSWLRRTLTSLAFTIGFVVFGIAVVTLLGAGAAAKAYIGEGPALIVQILSWPVLVLALGAALALLYTYGPSRDPVKLRWISWGSAVALLAWLAMSAAFTLYVANFGHYNKTYGSLGALIGFMTWIYFSAIVVLAGAELNAEMEHQTAADTTVGAPRPMGARGAEMADTLGAAQT